MFDVQSVHCSGQEEFHISTAISAALHVEPRTPNAEPRTSKHFYLNYVPEAAAST